MTYARDALDRLDMRAFLSTVGADVGKVVGTDEFRITCPVPGHADANPSANVNVRNGLWHCKSCDTGGSAIDWLMVQGADYADALREIGKMAGLSPPGHKQNGSAGEAVPTVTKGKLTEKNVAAWHEAALRNAELLTWFHDHRGFTDETIAHYELGWDGARVTIPVRDLEGHLVNVRRYLRGATDDVPKILPILTGMGPDKTTRIYPAEPMPDEILIVEGEWDAIIGRQHGLEGVYTVTSGAGIWNPTFTPLFANKVVTLAYDNDDAGRKGAAKVARILSNVTDKVRILQVPNLPEKGDLTDFFVGQGRDVDELRILIADATPFVVAPAAVEEEKAVRTSLDKASNAGFRGTRLELPVLLSGKAMTPYTVPYEFNVHCDMSNKRFCAICPMQEVSGNRDVVLAASDPAVLSLVGVTNEAQYKAIKQLARAVQSCTRPQITVKSSINIEELRLIPELDAAVTAGDGGDTEYVARQGFFLGHGLLPNRSYAMRGYAHPHPKNQQTVHLLSEAEPAQDNISAFALTPELVDELRVFQVAEGGVEGRWRDIYDDFADTVHRIRDRFDMQIAYDLVWHSVIGFYFNGAFVRRGWVEAMVMGDSGQGKSEMAEHLLRHYRLGYRLPAEQTSLAGLLGGLEKMGDTWLLSWGAIPQNDKRMVIIDEAQGLHEQTIEAMSDVRASGVAEITKIRTERTTARCRIAWIANPVSGMTLAQHNQGVLAIKELFQKPEDVRRLDLAITAASGDVDFERSINVRHAEATTPRYMSNLCRSLALWAWSRRPDQVEFTQPATDAILAAATSMGRRYHASIPLVEPSDQRLKLARLAAATAARVYSTDETGERLIVRPEHVEFVVDFLERVYNAGGMSYGEYSDAMRRGESLTELEEEDLRDEISRWGNGDEAVEFFRTATIFRKSDLVDGVGWEDSEAKARIRFLQSRRLVRPTRTGYYKTAAFISYLRSSGDVVDDLPEPDGANVPF